MSALRRSAICGTPWWRGPSWGIRGAGSATRRSVLWSSLMGCSSGRRVWRITSKNTMYVYRSGSYGISARWSSSSRTLMLTTRGGRAWPRLSDAPLSAGPAACFCSEGTIPRAVCASPCGARRGAPRRCRPGLPTGCVVAQHPRVAVGGALLGVAVDLTDRRVDIDDQRAGRGSLGGPGPFHRAADDGFELAVMTEDAMLVMRTASTTRTDRWAPADPKGPAG